MVTDVDVLENEVEDAADEVEEIENEDQENQDDEGGNVSDGESESSNYKAEKEGGEEEEVSARLGVRDAPGKPKMLVNVNESDVDGKAKVQEEPAEETGGDMASNNTTRPQPDDNPLAPALFTIIDGIEVFYY